MPRANNTPGGSSTKTIILKRLNRGVLGGTGDGKHTQLVQRQHSHAYSQSTPAWVKKKKKIEAFKLNQAAYARTRNIPCALNFKLSWIREIRASTTDSSWKTYILPNRKATHGISTLNERENMLAYIVYIYLLGRRHMGEVRCNR